MGGHVRVSGVLIGLASLLVPAWRRREWREEWESELWYLVERGESTRALEFARGSFRHAWSQRGRGAVVDVVRQDVRHAVRGLLRTPLFAVVSALTLGLGIGANATVVSLLNGLLVRAPPGVSGADRLVQVGRNREPASFDNWSWPAYEAMRAELGGTFAGMAGWTAVTGAIGLGDETRPAAIHLVSAEYFDVLGVPLVVGRGLASGERSSRDAWPVAVLSYDVWLERYGGAADVIGREIVVNGQVLEITGVAARGFGGADVFRAAADVFVPIGMQSLLRGRTNDVFDEWTTSWVWVFARLAPGVTWTQAAVVANAFLERLAASEPVVAGSGLQIVRGVGVQPEARLQASRVTGLLLGLAVLVLLIACSNLGSLALARATGRVGEAGVRRALGASTARIVHAHVVEALLLGLAGAAVAMVLVFMAAPVLHRVLPVPVAVPFTPDLRVVLWTFAGGMVAGLSFGLVPALSIARRDVMATLRTASSARGSPAGGQRVRAALVTTQIALAFVVLAAAGLLLRSIRNVYAMQPGFETSSVVTITLDARLGGHAGEAGWSYWRSLVERTRSTPGVEAAAVAESLPIVDFHTNRSLVAPRATPGPDDPPPLIVWVNTIDDGYFGALRIPVVRGRGFDAADLAGRDAVVVVNEQLATRLFVSDAAVGSMVPLPGRIGAAPDGTTAGQPAARIIGVVSDHMTRGAGTSPVPLIYLPYRAGTGDRLTLVARVRGDPGAAQAALMRSIAAADPGVPILRSGNLRDLMAATAVETQATSRLVNVFGILGLILAMIGLHGLLANTVVQRRRELAVRAALGARSRDVIGLVLGQSVRIMVAGLAIGLLLAIIGLRALRGLLFGVQPSDPFTLLAIGGVLMATAVITCLLPAHRAAAADPVRVLNES